MSEQREDCGGDCGTCQRCRQREEYEQYAQEQERREEAEREAISQGGPHVSEPVKPELCLCGRPAFLMVDKALDASATAYNEGESVYKYSVRCAWCGIRQADLMFDSPEKAIAAWNHRAPDRRERLTEQEMDTIDTAIEVAETNDFNALVVELRALRKRQLSLTAPTPGQEPKG